MRLPECRGNEPYIEKNEWLAGQYGLLLNRGNTLSVSLVNEPGSVVRETIKRISVCVATLETFGIFWLHKHEAVKEKIIVSDAAIRASLLYGLEPLFIHDAVGKNRLHVLRPKENIGHGDYVYQQELFKSSHVSQGQLIYKKRVKKSGRDSKVKKGVQGLPYSDEYCRASWYLAR